MPKYLCIHTMPVNSITREHASELAQAAQRDPVVKGYRSFISMSGGKVACILESPSEEALASWFGRMGLPFDSISKVELEGFEGKITDVQSEFGGESAGEGQQITLNF